jgi:hypothetical protein
LVHKPVYVGLFGFNSLERQKERVQRFLVYCTG